MTQGIDIKFDDFPPKSTNNRQRLFSTEENQAVDDEIQNLLRKQVVKKSEPEEGQYVSPIFVVEKKDGSHRMILNLKCLNVNVEYQKFKMESILTALSLVTPNCFFASIDLRDAYYSVPVDQHYQKYLKFTWRGQLYCFLAAPMGLGPVPRIFTKLTKPVLADLHDKGHMITSFIDDSMLVGRTEEETVSCVVDTVHLFDSLG